MSEEIEEVDPYSEENIKVLQWVTQARIYDVLLAILHQLNKDVADDLLEVHGNGALMSSAPVFTGMFISDEVNKDADALAADLEGLDNTG